MVSSPSFATYVQNIARRGTPILEEVSIQHTHGICFVFTIGLPTACLEIIESCQQYDITYCMLTREVQKMFPSSALACRAAPTWITAGLSQYDCVFRGSVVPIWLARGSGLGRWFSFCRSGRWPHGLYCVATGPRTMGMCVLQSG